MDALRTLTECLARLPGVGRRSASRMALSLVRDRAGALRDLTEALRRADETVRCCSGCGSMTAVGQDPCRLCTDPARCDGRLCVVEEPDDIMRIEDSGGFRGRYHALMGRISPLNGEAASDLRVARLLQRVRGGGVEEVVLALSTDGAGEAMAAFLVELLKKEEIQVTRLAWGLPSGSAVMYSDPVTLARAMRGRQPA